MKRIKYILTLLPVWFAVLTAYGQTQTLGLSQSQTGYSSSNCGSCFTVSIQYSISNVAATGTTIVANFPNTIFDLCSGGGASVSGSTLTFNLGSLPTSASSVSYQLKFKPGVTCNGTNGVLSAQITTNQHPSPVSTTSSISASANENWNIYKYMLKISDGLWYSSYGPNNPLNYEVLLCGNKVDAYYVIQVYNNGCINLKNSSVTDSLPAGATVVGVHTGWPLSAANLIPFTNGPGTVKWNVGNGSNTLLTTTGYYYYYLHVTFPKTHLNTVKCNKATLKGTNVCTDSIKTITTSYQCLKLIGDSALTECGEFDSKYYYYSSTVNKYVPHYFIGCSAWLNIGISQRKQCEDSLITLNNISYNTAIPVEMHVDNFKMNAIPTGKSITISINTTCGTFSQTYAGPLAATTVDFYAAPFSLAPSCVITNFSLATNMSITGNNSINFGQLGFTILANTWDTNAPVVPPKNVFMTGATYNSSNGSFGCVPGFVANARVPKIETIKQMCNYNENYNCVNTKDTINYSISVQNYGIANFNGGSIRDVLPVGLEYVPNSTTFSRNSSRIPCNTSNQANTGMSVVHAESKTSTSLQWNLPTLVADCDNSSDWYVINFKAVITETAPAGLLTNRADCYDGSNAIVPELPFYYAGKNNNSDIYVCERKVPLELTKEVSKDNVNWDSCVSVSPGSSVYYRLKVKNAGNVPFSKIKMLDLLPSIGDAYVVNCNSRGSTMPIYLTSDLPLGNAISIEYSTNQTPTRGALLNLVPDNTIACNSPASWLSYSAIPGIPSAIQNQRAIKIDFDTYTLAAGQTETYYFSAQVPPGATPGMIGWNSFAATASQNNVNTLGAESKSVCVTIDDSSCGCIGDFVWIDNNLNGLQDSGEAGINGCTITLFDAANNQVGLPHISTFNVSGQPGYYQFCGLTAGTYYMVVTPPAGMMVTVQNNTNPALNSDINPATNKSANFQFNCQDNNDLDIGLVKDDGCDCNRSHWGDIFISSKSVVIDNPSHHNEMSVNKMNKMAGSSVGVEDGRKSTSAAIAQPTGGNTIKLACGQKEMTLDCNKTYKFGASYVCSQENCGSVQIIVTPPSGPSSTFTNTASFTTNMNGYYTVKIIGKCGAKECDSCEFKFRVNCPICPCEYKLDVKPEKASQKVVNSNPKYTLLNQSFGITAPSGVAFTQLRAEVVSFDLKSGFNNECVDCKNLPYSWGSIFNASDINTNAAVADSITMGTNPPVTQFTPTLANTHQNPRETIWENYSGFTIPTSLNMQFVLPAPSVISCCTLYVKLCVKFTFRDLNCKECEVIKCIEVIIPPKRTVVIGTPSTSSTKGATLRTQPNDDCATCGDNMSQSGTENISTRIETLSNSKENNPEEEMSDEEISKDLQDKIQALKKLKENGVKRGDVEQLPELERQMKMQPINQSEKKTVNRSKSNIRNN